MARGSYPILEQHWQSITGENQGATSDSSSSLQPFWTVDRNDEDAVLKRLEDLLMVAEDEQLGRALNQVNNVNFFNGIQRLAIDGSSITTSGTYLSSSNFLPRSSELVINDARDYVNQSVNRLLRYSPNLNILPINNEYKDRLGARLSKRVVDNIFYINNAPDLFREMCLQTKLCGESFLFCEYDHKRGDLNPAFKKFMDQQKAIADSEGRAFEPEKMQFVTAQGETINLDIAKRVGEVSYVVPLSWFVFQEPAFRWRDVNWVMYGTIKHRDEVAAENPGVDLNNMKVIDGNKDRAGYGPGFKYGNYVVEYKFYHRRHQFLDGGWFCKFIPGVLLQSEKPAECYSELPCGRFTDFDDIMQAHGISFLEDLKPCLVMQNKMYGLMYRNMAIANHPKLLVPNGSCNISSFANGPMTVEYEYPMKPELLTFDGNGTEIFTITEKFQQKIAALSGTFDISRGEALPNARAASILNFYQEQEEQRESQQIKKYSAFIEKIGRLSLGVAGSFYQADDGRTLRVVGSHNYYKVRQLDDVTKLSGPYQVKTERTTALSESKQGRIDQIVALSSVPISQSPADAVQPGIFTREQILRMIEVADTPTFFEMATAAAEKQESENEDMFEGYDVDDPQPWEAHIVCWNVLFQFIQSREFLDTKGLPPEVKQKIIRHLGIHEMFMYEQAIKSLSFAQGLMQNVYYPAVFQIGPDAQLPRYQRTIAQLIMIHQLPPQMPPPPGQEPPPGEGEAPPPNQAGVETPPIEGENQAEMAPPPEEMPQAEQVQPVAPAERQPMIINVYNDMNKPPVTKKFSFERNESGEIIGGAAVPEQ